MNTKKIFIIGFCIIISLIFIVIYTNKGSAELSYNPPKNGMVPDETTAIKISEVIGLQIFGTKINDYKPFYAKLEKDSIWHVYGLPKKSWFFVQFGGCPQFEIQKKDGKILRVYISK